MTQFRESRSLSYRSIMLAIAAALLCTVGQSASAGAASGNVDAVLSVVSSTPLAGEDVRLEITLSLPDGKSFVPAMLDAASLRFDLGDGQEFIPRKEGLKTSPVNLGSDLKISRVVNVGSQIKLEGPRRVRAWWEYGKFSSETITFGIFPWPLDQVQAVMQTDQGIMVLEFHPDKAPRTVANFINLSVNGFYDGLTFHRIMPDFMIQGGCPNGDGTGGPGYSIKAEFNDISHERGVISMARSTDPDSAGSQFFIMLQHNRGLDGEYTAFGKLVSGLETLDRIAGVEITVNPYNAQEISKPKDPPIIQKIAIRLKEK